MSLRCREFQTERRPSPDAANRVEPVESTEKEEMKLSCSGCIMTMGSSFRRSHNFITCKLERH